MFCQKCGAKNDDSAAYCNKCGAAITKAEEVPEVVVVHANGLRDRIEIGTKDDGQPDVKVVKGDVPKKGIAIAIVAILLVAGAGLAFWQFGNGGNDSTVFTPTDGVFVLTDEGTTNSDQTLFCSGTITITMKDGVMSSNADIKKKDVVKTGITISPTVIKRSTASYPESYNVPLWPNYCPTDDMKASFAFLDDYNKTGVMCTFSDGATTVDAYKFTHNGGQYAIYVSTDGVIYEWCQSVDDLVMKFYLNGWTRTSNGTGNYH